MQFDQIAPLKPTLSRWYKLYSKFPGTSVLRALEYEKLEASNIPGKVLDVGGGENARYVKLLNDADVIESVNIDPDIKPTHLIQEGGKFPIEDNIFDNAVCLNTLEHVYDAKFVMQETLRVLKPGGKMYITVPFMFRIHAHPDDFFRATPSWWRQAIEDAGFSSLELEPLIWGRYTTGRSITGYRGPLARLRFHLTHFKDWFYAAFSVRGKRYDGRRGERIIGVSSGWFMTATK